MKSQLQRFLFLILIIIVTFLTSKSFSTVKNVTAANFVFTPSSISAAIGDTIRWTWIGGNHTTTCDGSSFTSRPSGAAPWNANLNSVTTTFSYVVTVAGTYNYKCTFHAPSMVGVITVTAPASSLNLTSIIEGFWNGTVMVSDTVKAILHNSSSPYARVDSGKVKLSTSGNGIISFTNASSGSYYIDVRHRNSIQTWSKLAQSFTSGNTTNYNFTTAAAQAFGDNLTLKLGKFTIYSGDPNHDDAVDLSDIVLVYNDANNFVSGYVVSDINGDSFTDLSDIVITFNNASAFVSVIRP